jgi:hypothetical protein
MTYSIKGSRNRKRGRGGNEINEGRKRAINKERREKGRTNE